MLTLSFVSRSAPVILYDVGHISQPVVREISLGQHNLLTRANMFIVVYSTTVKCMVESVHTGLTLNYVIKFC